MHYLSVAMRPHWTPIEVIQAGWMEGGEAGRLEGGEAKVIGRGGVG